MLCKFTMDAIQLIFFLFLSMIYKKNWVYSIHSEFAQHKKIIGKKIPIFAQEYKTAK